MVESPLGVSLCAIGTGSSFFLICAVWVSAFALCFQKQEAWAKVVLFTDWVPIPSTVGISDPGSLQAVLRLVHHQGGPEGKRRCHRYGLLMYVELYYVHIFLSKTALLE